MDEFLDLYRELDVQQKIWAELLFYSFLAEKTKNESKIRISKSNGKTLSGEKIIKYEIEVPADD